MGQLSFLSPEDLPPGLFYLEDFISAIEEEELLAIFRTLTLSPFEFQGYTAKRNVLHFGSSYDFGKNKVSEAGPVPYFLSTYVERAATALKISPERITQTLITHYPVGAPIGWHRDASPFEHLLGISLLSSCTMKLREMSGTGKKSLFLERRSAYIMTGPARWRWEHHIPPVKEERYSLTFRTHVKDNPVSDYDL